MSRDSLYPLYNVGTYDLCTRNLSRKILCNKESLDSIDSGSLFLFTHLISVREFLFHAQFSSLLTGRTVASGCTFDKLNS